MANPKEKYKKELLIQEQIEGKSEDIELVRKILEIVHTSDTWQTLTDTKFHRYGVESWKMHRFHYPTELVKKIMKLNEVEEKQVKDKKYTEQDMKDFANFIRNNYYGVGAPKLMSYDPSKYPHGKVEQIFGYWSNDKEKVK
jgi:hypothetical protein